MKVRLTKTALACNFVGALIVAVAGYFGLAAGFGGPILWSDWRWCTTWWFGWAVLAAGFVLQWIALQTTRLPQATKVDEAADVAETTDDRDALRTQLSELNTRGRHYASQLWQVPFAYVGIVGVVLAQVADKDKRVIRAALVAGFVFGIPALVHLTAMVNGTKRAMVHIRRRERALGLIPTVEYMPYWYAGPLVVVVLLTSVVCGITAICLP